jgi:hypothetical protein
VSREFGIKTGILLDSKTDDFGDSVPIPSRQSYVSAGVKVGRGHECAVQSAGEPCCGPSRQAQARSGEQCLKLRKGLNGAMGRVSDDTQPSFGEPWGLLGMAQASSMDDATTATVVNSRLSFAVHRP